MPGASSRYVFIGKTPWPVRAVVAAGGINLVASSALRSWASHTAVPDAVHSYALYHHRSATYYSPLLGRYFAGGFLAVHLLFMGIMALLFWAYRERLRPALRQPAVPYSSTGWFLVALVVPPVLLSLVGGFLAGIFWREGAPLSWLLAGALPFPLLSLLGVRSALRALPDPRHPPIPRWLCWGLGLMLSMGTVVAVGWLAI
jgi:hypothetical protein